MTTLTVVCPRCRDTHVINLPDGPPQGPVAFCPYTARMYDPWEAAA